MASRRSYTDEALREAVAGSHSWRGVLRALGLAATSASALRSVRSHAERLGLDYAHFTGQRRWSDAELAAAVAGSGSWPQVAETLGLSGGSAQVTLKAHAVRLGLDTGHFAAHVPPAPSEAAPRPDLRHLARAGSLLAASWFALCGYDVSWPLEPARYDLVVALPTGLARIQVKTATVRAGGAWQVWLSTTGAADGRRAVYDPDDVDHFFVIDGDMSYFLLPVAVVGGRHSITLSGYEAFKVESLIASSP